MEIVVSGLGWVVAGGFGRGATGTFPGLRPGRLPEVKRKDLFDNPDRQFGRLDPFSRLGVAAAALALQDAGRAQGKSETPTALVAESRWGCLTTDAAYFETVVPDQGAMASPHLFAYTLPNTFLGEVGIRFGLTGPAAVVHAGPNRGVNALAWGLETLAWEPVDAVAVGLTDLVPEGEDDLSGALFAVLEPVKGDGVGLQWSPESGLVGPFGPIDDLLQLALMG